MCAHGGSQLRTVERWLEVLAYRPRDRIRVAVLRAGPSGASTFRLGHGDEQLILKVVPADSPPHALERGRREVRFYHHLSSAVPLRTPEVLALHESSPEGCALLLRAGDAPPRIADWGCSLYRIMASQLAALHATYWDRTDELERFAWLRGFGDAPGGAPSPAQALASWRALWRQPRLTAVFGTRVVRAIETGIHEIERLRDRIRRLGLPFTLCHGDAHHENVLMGADGTWLWADWQEVGVGHGTDDLSFFYQRAAAAGGSPDLPDMLLAYQAELERRGGIRLATETLQLAVAVREAIQRLAEWPHYLASASQDVVRRHVERTLNVLDHVRALERQSR